MKEFVLSVLSRGCSHVVQTDGSSHCGRLEICFEPEDYFTWKSQPTLLRLSSSGRLLSAVEPTPPKTYSTRRGPLILYSEDFALSSYQADKVVRKGKAFHSFGEEAEIQLHSLRDLTEAALAYSVKRVKQARLGGHSSITQPPLPVPKHSAKHSLSHRRLGDEQTSSLQLTEGDEDQASSRAHGNAACPRPEQTRYHPRFLCVPPPPRPPPGLLPLLASSTAPRRSLGRPHLEQDAHLNSKPKGAEESPLTRDRMSFRTDVEMPRVQMSPELTGWCKEQRNNMLLTPQVAEHLTGLPKDLKGQWNRTAMGTGGVEDGRSFKPACADLSLGSDHPSKDSDRRHAEGGWQPGLVKRSDADVHARNVIVSPNPSLNVHHLPPIKQEILLDTKEHGLKAGTTTREIRDSVPRLPDIHLPDLSAEDPGPKPPTQTLLKKVFVLLPPPLDQERLHGLPEEEEEMKDVLSGEVKQKESIGAGDDRLFEAGRGLKAEQDQLIWFEPDEDKEHQTTLGPLPPFVGRRGLGKQCSMALYRQDPRDLADQAQPESGITRGSLPLELRECQKGGVLGTLIMGPAGEIIRLSFWDPLTDTEDHPALEDAMREHVLRVMTSDGVLDQPWTILLQDQTQTGEVNDSKPKAKQSSKKQATFNQSDSECNEGDDNVGEDIATPRAPDGSIKAAEKAEDLEPDERRCGVYLHPPSHLYTAIAPEKRSEKIKRSAENQPHGNGEDIKKQMRGRTRSQQPEGRARPGSPKPTSEPANNPRKTNLSTPKATDEAKPKRKTEAPKETAKTRSRNAGGTDQRSDRQMRKVKEEEDQDEGGATENKDEEEKRVQIDTGTEPQETRSTAETSPGVVGKKNKKAAGDKSKAEPSTSQNLVKKVKKSSKGQAAFIVGKPRPSQDVQPSIKKTSGAEKRSSNSASDETEEKLADDRRRTSPAHGREAPAGAEPGLADDQPLQEPRVSTAGLVQVSREAGASLDADQISDVQEGYAHGTPSRSPSCVSKNSSGTWSYRRSSVTSDTDLCSPVPSSFTRTSPQCAVPTHQHAASTPRSEPAADPKASTEATNQRDSQALAEKAERRRLEVERKRKEKEEEKKRQQERDEREERMRRELEEEQKQRAEQTRLKKLRDEEERRRQAERETERRRREQAEMERDRRRQEEKRRLLERLQRERLEEEARRAAELRHQQQEEEARREEEWRRLEEMEESERLEYLRRQKEEEEERRKALEERRRAEEEAAMRAKEEARLLAELYKRQRAALEQQLHFHRGLFVEAEGLDQTQDISRPWVFSYFSLMKVLGLTDCNAL